LIPHTAMSALYRDQHLEFTVRGG